MNANAVGHGVAVAVAAIVLAVPTVRAQQKTLSLDDIYDPQKRVSFSGRPAAGMVWTDATHFAWPRTGANGTEWTKQDAALGEATPLYDAARMETALAALPGVSKEEARRLAHSRSLIFSRAFSAALVTIANDLYVYQFDEGRAVRLTDKAPEESYPSFSPDGRAVAFVRQNDLFVVDVRTRQERRLTKDGSPKILNGVLDWVYEEEIYGRGEKAAYWWSPDSSSLAFLQLDDRSVPTYLTVDPIPYAQEIERWDYPKAGDPNPIAKIGVVRADGGSSSWVDTTKYPAADTLVVRVGWTPDSRRVVFEVENRTQTWLDLNEWDARARATRTIIRETNQHWTESDEATLPTWLADGSFLWLSDRSGWKHLYRYKADGTLVNAVTSGTWEVRSLHGIAVEADRENPWIYFSGTERSPIGSDAYRVRLDGSGLQRISAAAGTHRTLFSPGLSFYLDSWSNATTPTQLRVHRNDGGELRIVDENKVPALEEYRLSKPEFLQVPTRDGFVMEAMIIKPPDFDPSRKYPVYQFTYAGPHNQTVRNAWGGTDYMYHQLLAQKGIIVWVCDNRTASGKGSESVWALKNRFGEIELRDIEDGVAWLKSQPFVDGSRIGIHGWSYGGFMTTYALTHSATFAMGIAGGTVADWRDYDTVYTERYLGLPGDNADGYRASSPRWSAANLHGALMLIHGEVDDNVHVANTMQLAYELQKAQKPFRLMIYPKSRHGVTDPALARHLRETMLGFVLEHLHP